jgi:hypothetical protein
MTLMYPIFVVSVDHMLRAENHIFSVTIAHRSTDVNDVLRTMIACPPWSVLRHIYSTSTEPCV